MIHPNVPKCHSEIPSAIGSSLLITDNITFTTDLSLAMKVHPILRKSVLKILTNNLDILCVICKLLQLLSLICMLLLNQLTVAVVVLLFAYLAPPMSLFL